MDCTPAQKVRYGTHMLAEEADDWWLEARQRLETANEEITWAVIRDTASLELCDFCFHLGEMVAAMLVSLGLPIQQLYELLDSIDWDRDRLRGRWKSVPG